MSKESKTFQDCFIPLIEKDSDFSVCGLLHIGRTKAGELIKREDFPKPVKLGGRCLRFRLSEVMAWASGQDNDSDQTNQGAAA